MAFENISASASSHANFAATYADIVQMQQTDAGNQSKFGQDISALNTDLHGKGLLSGIDLTGLDGSNHLIGKKGSETVDLGADSANLFSASRPAHHSFLGGIFDVAKDVVEGGIDEVIHHPVRLLENAAIGAGLGAAAVLLGPEVCAVTGVLAAGYGIYEIAKNAGGWAHDAAVTYNPNGYTKDEVGDAKEGLAGIGAGAVEAVASVAGGAAGGWATSAARAALIGSLSTEAGSAVAAEDVAQLSPAQVSQPVEQAALTTDPSPSTGDDSHTLLDGVGDDAKSVANAVGNVAQNVPGRVMRTAGRRGAEAESGGFDPIDILQYVPS